MKLLVIGSGGREHALAWKLAQSPKVSQVYVAPGNGGTATESGLLNVPISAIPALVEFARREEIALTVVGPEAPLAAGVVDAFRAAGLKIFGPSAAAAQLESSKDFAKQFMARHGIPTAAFGTFTDEEASFIVMVDGEHVLALASSQDHKRLGDGDSGPNTGGMGAYSPAPVVTPELHARIMREVIHPTVEGMAADGIRYTGFLYAGIMVGADGAPRVLEFNCRMGDPETQPIMMRLKSDLSVLLDAGVNGKLDQVEAEWDRRAALGVVIAAAGYPASPQQGAIVGTLPAAADDLHIFHAGTTAQDERIVVSGGRVLVVTALGDSVRLAQKRAYEAIADVRFDGMQYRRDIGWRALDRKK